MNLPNLAPDTQEKVLFLPLVAGEGPAFLVSCPRARRSAEMPSENRRRICSLEDIWPLQGRLNMRAGFDTLGLGCALREVEKQGKLRGDAELRHAVGKGLKNYLDALMAECMELQDCLAWKHWYREAKDGRQHELQDVQNARVEAIDMLFFWVSICQLLGLSPQDVYRLYGKKLRINILRQEEDRSQLEHHRHEDENKSVT